MSKRFLLTIITVLAIAATAGVAIFLAKGYTFSPQERRIVGTGIITITSEPDAASVFIDGHLTTATNTTLASLTPKDYSIKIVKEGFIPWGKKIAVKEGVVTDVKVTLFPAIPTIYPLTFSGVKNPILSPDGSKLAYIVTPGASTKDKTPGMNKKAGVWVWTQLRNQPISFARSSEPHQIAQSGLINFSDSTLRWSTDSKQLLATVGPPAGGAGSNNYLLDADKLNSDPRDITPLLEATLKGWEEDAKAKDTSRIEAIRNLKLRKIASESAVLRWSPDETKFIARLNPVSGDEKDKTVGGFKVYNLEDGKDYDLPPARDRLWLPNSKHVILVEEGDISVVDFDGSNKAIIYAGSFLDNFVFPWLDSSRLVIISSFPTPTASEPNLYGINLK